LGAQAGGGGAAAAARLLASRLAAASLVRALRRSFFCAPPAGTLAASAGGAAALPLGAAESAVAADSPGSATSWALAALGCPPEPAQTQGPVSAPAAQQSRAGVALSVRVRT
jgi:hypothetical protein